MGEVPTLPSVPRRSSRVFIRIPIRASGKNRQGQRFRERCETIVVSAHGALLYLNETVELGALLTLHNPATQEEEECRVVYLGEPGPKGQRVGVEFLSPAPHFWCMEFSPEDWVSHSSAPRQPN
ncbi:MAG: PilZ domain-containing protein [Firmicutes bacterium]|nr:PilZ domain-containing protein [Bacillota bacterium]